MSTLVDDYSGMPSTKVADNPFPGLRPFKIEESHLFFGREGQSDEVLLKLSKNRFVGVIGPSGSGKSSFIYCGVLPILYGGFLTDASPNWEVVVTRPGSGPIDNLSEALLKTAKDYTAADTEDKKIKRTIVSTLLRSSSLGLVEAIQQSRRSEDINYLILVDQFEELFRFKDSTDPNSVNETLAFVNLLMEAINYEDAPIYVAITMRSDFIGDCAQFPELTRKINDSHYLIPQMTRDQKRRAVEGPVAVGGAKISPRLTQQLLNDLGDNPDQLPILQHALMRTWSYWANYRDVEDEPLDLKHYEAIGTMSEALSMHANEAYDELEDDQKHVCEALFKAITEKRGENFGIRRPTRLNEIAAIADVSEEEVMAVIEKFREPGRSLLTPAHGTPLTSRSMVDISHESLMRIWVRLKNWVDDEAEAVQMYLRLSEAAAQYQVGKAGLWRPPDLQLALNWQAKHKPTLVWGQRYNPAFERTMIFLEYSKKEFETEQRIKELEAKRKLQRARTTALVLGAFLLLALVAMVYAFVQQVEANTQRAEALKQQERAEQNANEAKRQEEIAKDAEKEARAQELIAKNALTAAKVAEAEAKRQAEIAEQQRQEAVKQEALAKRNESRAVAAQKLAEEKEREALAAKRESDRLRYVATAKAMALKTADLKDEKETIALLGQQAYNFNKKHGGTDGEFDNDIYNGLFRALDANRDPLTQSLEGHRGGAARAVEPRVESNHIYSGGSDGRIIIWDYSKRTWVPEVLRKSTVGEPGGATFSEFQVYTLDISPDESMLAAGGLYTANRNANYVELYSLRDKSLIRKITGFVGDVENLHFAPDGKGFYARDNAGRSIKYADLTTAREVVNPSVKINALDLSPDGRQLVGAGKDGNIYVWDIRNNFRETIIKVSSAELTAVVFAPEGRRIITGDERGVVRIFDNGLQVRQLSGHKAAVERIRFNHAGTFMATGSKDFSIRLWNMKRLNDNPIVMSDHDWIWSMAFTPDDEQLVAGINSKKEDFDRSGRKVYETIHAWPTNMKTMSGLLCGYAKRNMTQEEWEGYTNGLAYEKTCDAFPKGN
ncbi:MAG: High-affnity carbon uptake protein Hat/HatR [Cyclobacteriaceae bacterium]|nr:High-affnity carbon uptake protein Hat/HatR [Cyclobacteriaceae bacterium]